MGEHQGSEAEFIGPLRKAKTFEEYARWSPEVAQLVASEHFAEIRRLVSKHTSTFMYAEEMLSGTIRRGLSGPRPHEQLTRGERGKAAERIVRLCDELRGLLLTIHGDAEIYRDWPFEFRTELDLLALRTVEDFREKLPEGTPAELLADTEGDAFYVARASVYHLLQDGLPELLDTLAGGAEAWKESGGQPLAKPNHKNARRLYFIRAVTDACVACFGAPARELTLLLTSVYFDCSDLDEAALSNLAPVRKGQESAFR